MKRILIIEDDNVCSDVLGKTLTDCGYEVSQAFNGKEGLEVASTEEPDLLLVDILLPELNGEQIIRRLRTDSRFLLTPIIVLSGDSDLKCKLKAFEAGADDFLSKPVEGPELMARISRLLQRQVSPVADAKIGSKIAHVIGVHGMRGGVGCTSIAVNLASALFEIWKMPTLLVDATSEGGQVALLLDGHLQRTWGELGNVSADQIDASIVDKIINQHGSGLDYLASPRMSEELGSDVKLRLVDAVKCIRSEYEYIVIDLGQAWDAAKWRILEMSDHVVPVLAPDFASLATTIGSIERYQRMNVDLDRIQMAINNLSDFGLKRAKVESTIKHPVRFELPFAPSDFYTAMETGQPFAFANLRSEMTWQFLKMAFDVSKDAHVNVPPPRPSTAWQVIMEKTDSIARRHGRIGALGKATGVAGQFLGGIFGKSTAS